MICKVDMNTNSFLRNRFASQNQIYLEPLLEGKNKVGIYGPGHMTMMAAMALNSKNIKKSSFVESYM